MNNTFWNSDFGFHLWLHCLPFTHKAVTLPNRLMIPQPTHTSRLRPTDPVPANTPLGEIKMPDPTKFTYLQ